MRTRHIPIMLSIALILPVAAFSAELRHSMVSIVYPDGSSLSAEAEAEFLTGSEMNKALDTYDFNPFSTYVVVSVRFVEELDEELDGENNSAIDLEFTQVILTLSPQSMFIASGSVFYPSDLDRLVSSGSNYGLVPVDPTLPPIWNVLPLEADEATPE